MNVFSKKVDYGILALYHLMQKGEGVSSSDLARQYGISRSFVGNILKALCQQGLIVSQRGVRGGYWLSRDPREITLEMVIEAIDGPFGLMRCMGDSGSANAASCYLFDRCPVRNPLLHVHERMLATLNEFTIADLGHNGPALVHLPEERLLDGCPSDLS